MAALSTWLMTIARNVAMDHYRPANSAGPLEEAEGGRSARRKTPAVGRSDAERLARAGEGYPIASGR